MTDHKTGCRCYNPLYLLWPRCEWCEAERAKQPDSRLDYDDCCEADDYRPAYYETEARQKWADRLGGDPRAYGTHEDHGCHIQF